MPKSISAQLKAHLAQSVTTMTSCWLIQRLDGQTFGFTTFDQDLTIGGQLYQSTSGFSRSAIATHSTGQVDNLEVLGYFSGTGIIEQDLKNGLFNYATIYVFAVNWADLTMGICKLRRGFLGETVRSPGGFFQAELRGITQALVQEFSNVFSPLCRVDLGDPLCKFDLTTVQQTGTVTAVVSQNQFQTTPLAYSGLQLGNIATINFVHDVSAGTALEISDGTNIVTVNFPSDTSVGDAVTATFAALPGSLNISAARGGDAITLLNNATTQGIIQKTGDIGFGIEITDFTANYLDDGLVTWLTGQNAGVSMELKTYLISGQFVILWLGMSFAISVGDTYRYTPGCDKRRDTCFNKFNNVLNFHGEPDMPGPDKMLSYPDAA
jgi:uncharacterized phage protein (TIGR02218 family)